MGTQICMNFHYTSQRTQLRILNPSYENSRVPQSKFETNQSRDSWVMIGHKNRDYYFVCLFGCPWTSRPICPTFLFGNSVKAGFPRQCVLLLYIYRFYFLWEEFTHIISYFSRVSQKINLYVVNKTAKPSF